MAGIHLIASSPDNNFIFLIDTSRSMYFCLRAVKKVVIDSLYDLLDKRKAYFNVMAFNTNVTAWADRAVPVTPENVAAAAYWVSQLGDVGKMLSSHLEAIFTAFDDFKCEAIFLFSNSRPVQKADSAVRSAIDSAKGRPINCVYPATTMTNHMAKSLMQQLASESGGSFTLIDIDDYGNLKGSSLVFGQKKPSPGVPLPSHCRNSSFKNKVSNKVESRFSSTSSSSRPPSSKISCRLSNSSSIGFFGNSKTSVNKSWQDDDDCLYNALDYADDYYSTRRGVQSSKTFDDITRELLYSETSWHIPAREEFSALPAPWTYQ